MIGYVAEYEEKKILQRTKNGSARAREERKRIGRYSNFDEYEEDLRQMKNDAISIAAMKARTGLA